jgi:hypothetical protein
MMLYLHAGRLRTAAGDATLMCSIAIALLCPVAVAPLHAEIEMVAVPTERDPAYHWWPKIRIPEGWHHERNASVEYSLNALAPDGFTFDDAPTVMYAKAVAKARELDVKSLQMFIKKDLDAVRANPGVEIKEVQRLTTADGKRLRSFTFFPKKNGTWDRVAYGEEGTFYLIFTVSSHTLGGYQSAGKAYQAMVGRYVEKPAKSSGGATPKH